MPFRLAQKGIVGSIVLKHLPDGAGTCRLKCRSVLLSGVY
jgi:hypothetical protein